MMIDPLAASLSAQANGCKEEKRRERAEVKPIEGSGEGHQSQLDSQHQDIEKRALTKTLVQKRDFGIYNVKGARVASGQPDPSSDRPNEWVDVAA